MGSNHDSAWYIVWVCKLYLVTLWGWVLIHWIPLSVWYIIVLWGWVLIHWISLGVWYIYSVVKMVHVYLFQWKASSTWYSVLLIWYDIAWTNECERIYQKQSSPFSKLFFWQGQKDYICSQSWFCKGFETLQYLFNIYRTDPALHIS
jgi:hypothetical protein